MFSSDDLARIQAHPWLGKVFYQPQVDSTNDWARRFLDDGLSESQLEIARPVLFLAGDQTAGRGQRDRRWWSSPGSLTATWVLSSATPHPPELPLATGWSIVRSIQNMFPELVPAIKWPNDVYLDDKKLAGVLCESVAARSHHFVLIGIGCNVNTNLSAAPLPLRERVISLADQLGQPIDLTSFLWELLDRLQESLDRLAQDPIALIDQCQSVMLWPLGERLKIERVGEPPLWGEFRGLGDRGELRIDVGGEERRIRSARKIEPMRDS